MGTLKMFVIGRREENIICRRVGLHWFCPLEKLLLLRSIGTLLQVMEAFLLADLPGSQVSQESLLSECRLHAASCPLPLVPSQS